VLQGSEILLQGASWADWDQAGRLVYVRAGRLFAGKVENGQLVERELLDLNPNRPTRVNTPDFAKQW
jgi:hypothetical protein